jgi:hypothetical protein
MAEYIASKTSIVAHKYLLVLTERFCGYSAGDVPGLSLGEARFAFPHPRDIAPL